MWLTKKQVRYLIAILKKNADSKSLFGIGFHDGWAYATDRYSLVRYDLANNTKLNDKFLPFTELKKWYQLAKSKDKLTEEILESLVIDLDPKFPQMSNLMESFKIAKSSSVLCNTDYLNNLAGALGSDKVEILFNGSINPFMVEAIQPDPEAFTRCSGLLVPIRSI